MDVENVPTIVENFISAVEIAFLTIVENIPWLKFFDHR
jgi:hypothetical protein